MPKILILANHYPVCSGRYMRDAFRRIGADVRTMGAPMENHIWGMDVDPRHSWQPDYPLGTDGPPTLQGHVDWQPDLAITMDSALAIHGSFGCPHVVYGVDNHVRNYRNLEVSFEHYFLAHHDGPTQPIGDEHLRVATLIEPVRNTWLPCAYDPIYFTPSKVPMGERKWDVCAIGVPYQHRAEIYNKMIAAGMSCLFGMGLLYEDYAAAYQNSRISLCISAAGDVAQRVFETAAMGCMVLTDDCADLKRLNFYDDVEGRVYHSPDEAVAIAKAMLDKSASGTLASIARAGQIWAKPHTWDERARVILETMELD